MGESDPRPSTEDQKQRARELDPPPEWLRQVAEQLGFGSRHSTRRALYHLIEAELMITGREVELLVWFLYGVSRHLGGGAWDGPGGSGISATIMEKLARRLAREPWVMASLKRYLPGTVYRFGAIYGSTDTLAFRVAARVLEEKIGISARTKNSGRR